MNQKKAILTTIDELAERKFGWDGGAALPIRRDAIDLARRLLHDDYAKVGCLAHCEPAQVDITESGEIQIELASLGRILVIEFNCSGAFSYQKAFSDGSQIDGVVRVVEDEPSGTSPSFVNALCRFNDLILWVSGGRS